MGKRSSSSADAKTLAAVQASLKEKAEAEKARLAMDPPPPPKKKSKKRTPSPPAEPSEPPSPSLSSTPSPVEPPEPPTAVDTKASSAKKRSPAPGVESKPKAKAKTSAKKKLPEDPIDFEITWDNHALLMKHFDITEDEATQCLLAVVGQDPKARKFWEKFVVKKPEVETAVEPTESDTEKVSRPPSGSKDNDLKTGKTKKGMTKAERDARRKEIEALEEVEDSQVENPLSDSDTGTTEDEDVSEEVASTSSGPPHDPPPPRGSAVPVKPESKIMDELETQPVEPEEPVIPPFAKDDPALEARKKLEMELKQVPTPSKVVAAAAQVG